MAEEEKKNINEPKAYNVEGNVDDVQSSSTGTTPTSDVQTTPPQNVASQPNTTAQTGTGVVAVSTDGTPVEASEETAKAEKSAQTAEKVAKDVTAQASDVKTVEGTQSASNVENTVIIAQDNATTAGSIADMSWDKDAVRGSQEYKDVYAAYAGNTDKDQARRALVYARLQPAQNLDDRQRAFLQYCEDVVKGEVKAPSPSNQQTDDTSNGGGVVSNGVETGGEKTEQPKIYSAPEVNLKGENGKSAKDTIGEKGFEGEGKDRHPVRVEWSPSKTNDAVGKEISDATDEYTKAIEDARKAKDEALAKVMDSSSSITDKADAIEAMAASDEIIRRYSDPEYVKRRKASKVIGMIADAFASLGNMLTAIKGGVPAKFDSATAKAKQAEKEEEAALQKRVDYWTKKMESARTSDLRSANFLRSRGITAALEDFRISSSKAKDVLNSRRALAKEYGARQAASDKEQLRLVTEHNKQADEYAKGVEKEKTYQKHRRQNNQDYTDRLGQKETSAKRVAKYRNELPPKSKKGGGSSMVFNLG